MAYIDKTYYDSDFKGIEVTASEFARLADIATDIINAVSVQAITDADAATDEVKKATAYQVEFLKSNGGIDAIFGAVSAKSESLGDYSVSGGGAIKTVGGVPVSQLAISQLQKAGLMNRWAYKRCEDGES